ncbi:hypothetical protein [Vibrio anguillarum]|uniref:Lipoprotein n=2 Tax=Vibrio anguillarum TaxID=55601 RepID=A0AAW4BKY6_VIBAN|nr:hypothetical protein [Vibrio anguillarum]MBF4437011.1 hypothetical protein [Vibrio anguillarum]
MLKVTPLSLLSLMSTLLLVGCNSDSLNSDSLKDKIENITWDQNISGQSYKMARNAYLELTNIQGCELLDMSSFTYAYTFGSMDKDTRIATPSQVENLGAIVKSETLTLTNLVNSQENRKSTKLGSFNSAWFKIKTSDTFEAQTMVKDNNLAQSYPVTLHQDAINTLNSKTFYYKKSVADEVYYIYPGICPN